MRSAAWSTGTGAPWSLSWPTKKPISSSKSMRRQGENTGASASGGSTCPRGRTTSVPDTTMELARPW